MSVITFFVTTVKIILELNFVTYFYNTDFFACVSGSDNEGRSRGSRAGLLETVNITMEVAQLLLSLMHAWGLDPDLDKVCEGKLGLLRPMIPVSFGIMSKGGKLVVIFDYCVNLKKCFLGNRVKIYKNMLFVQKINFNIF
jgi:hypothetical protein